MTLSSVKKNFYCLTTIELETSAFSLRWDLTETLAFPGPRLCRPLGRNWTIGSHGSQAFRNGPQQLSPICLRHATQSIDLRTRLLNNHVTQFFTINFFRTLTHTHTVASPCPTSLATQPSQLPSSTKPQATATCVIPL